MSRRHESGYWCEGREVRSMGCFQWRDVLRDRDIGAMSGKSIADPGAFILANTRLMSPPLTPELKLHLAVESLPIWQKTEEELGESGLPPPYWAFAWAGGQALARYVLDHPALVEGKAVLDLASGSGLVAIAARRTGARHVTANDIDAFAAVAIGLNAMANGCEIEAATGDLLRGPPCRTEVVLAGDIFYEKSLAERTLAWLRRCRGEGAEVLVGDPGRSYFPKSAFVAVAEYSVPVTRELEDSLTKRTVVWRLLGAS
jgi:predicted nicotinamide N-methyase